MEVLSARQAGQVIKNWQETNFYGNKIWPVDQTEQAREEKHLFILQFSGNRNTLRVTGWSNNSKIILCE